MPSEIVAELLISLDLGTKPHEQRTWPIFAGQMTTDPDEAIGVADVGRATEGRLLRTGETDGFMGFQVRVRSKKFATARTKTWEIWDTLQGVLRQDVTVEDLCYRIHAIHQLQFPNYIGSDPNARISFVLNCIGDFRLASIERA